MRATGARTDERPRRKRGPDFSAGKGESENPRVAESADALLTSQRHFLLLTFLCASKEKLPARRAEALHFKSKSKVTESVPSLR